MQINPPPPPSRLPDRRLIERLIGFLRTKPVIEPVAIEPLLPARTPTTPLDYPTEPIRPDKGKLKRLSVANSDLKNPFLFPEGSVLLMRAAGHKVLLENMRRDILLGRTPVTTQPHLPVRRVDLTYYAGYRSGMSRVHAVLRRTTNYRIQLLDMGSTNGTYLNRNRLLPFVPTYVSDGDEIRMGEFVVRVYFIYP